MVLSSAADEVCANMPVVEKVNTATIAVAIMALSFILLLVFLLKESRVFIRTYFHANLLPKIDNKQSFYIKIYKIRQKNLRIGCVVLKMHNSGLIDMNPRYCMLFILSVFGSVSVDGVFD